jgi:lysophospholipase L1-like esterase
MEVQGLDLHGIAELVEVRGRKILSRYPDHVNKVMGHTTAYQLNGTEIRLVPEEDCYITLESLGRRHATKVMVYYGDMPYPEEFHFEKEVTIPVFIAKYNEIVLSEKFPKPYAFSFKVVRLCIFSDNVLIKHISGKHRLPKADEVPSFKMMSYGSSVTQGYFPTSVDLTYPNILARSIKADLSNFGLAGTALCEKEVTDFLKVSGTYDLIVLELSVNMLAAGMTTKAYAQRVTYMLTEMVKHQPQAKILCLGILPFYGDYGMTYARDHIVSSADEFRSTYRKIVLSLNNPNVIYADPLKALSMHNLTTDFIHPSNFGMIEIAEYLKKLL